jgi:Domain of unknown function (DUF4124)
MHRIASFLLLVVAFDVSATEVWRWKDADGVVHYSDSPVPGAERINVGPAPQLGSPSADSGTPAFPAAQPQSSGDSTVRYKHCLIAQPQNDASFFAADSVNASLEIEPALQPGHQIQVFLNGAAYPQWPAAAMSYTLTGLFRGSYTLAVRVLDDNGRTVCSGPTINFYVRQPSVLSPQSPLRPQPKK